jgi:hypothetical protein
MTAIWGRWAQLDLILMIAQGGGNVSNWGSVLKLR